MAMNPNYTEQLGKRLVAALATCPPVYAKYMLNACGFTWPVRFFLYTRPLIGSPGDQNGDLLWGAPPLGPGSFLYGIPMDLHLIHSPLLLGGDIIRCCIP